MGIRVYETHSGIRLILGIQMADPGSPESRKLLRSFHADRLYVDLCARQNCYRARLTPKPYRIKMKSMRLRYPYEEKDREPIDAWVKEYTARSQGFSIVPAGAGAGAADRLARGPAPRREDEGRVEPAVGLRQRKVSLTGDSGSNRHTADTGGVIIDFMYKRTGWLPCEI